MRRPSSGIPAAALLATVLLLLTGCVTVAAPAPGLTGDELTAAREQQMEGRWAATGLYPQQRPAAPPVTTVTIEDWSDAYVKCMNNAGFDNYTALAEGGFSVSHPNGEVTELERLTDYLCAMSFEVEGEFDGVYNAAEIDYLYDYYATSLVPCLASRGFKPDSVPTRYEFASQAGSWHPYFAMHAEEWLNLFSDRSILIECPPSPAGMIDPGYATYFE